jgi:glycopeptide antibiotics resistance protein
MTFKEYVLALYNGIPTYAYEMLVSIAVLGIVFSLIWKGGRSGRYIEGLFYLEYIVLIFFSTAIFRHTHSERQFNFTPFWSYASCDSYEEIYMNVLVFIPLGFLLGWTFGKSSVVKTILAGLVISAIVEALQFFIKRGFSEIDDIIHNTLGCFIGYCLFLLVCKGKSIILSHS